MNIQLSVNNCPIGVKPHEPNSLQKQLKIALELLSSNPDLQIIGEDKKYNVADFPLLSELQYAIEYFQKMKTQD